VSDWDSFPRTREAIESGRDRNWHLGGQIYVSREGTALLDDAWGDQGDGEPLTNEHLMLWLSSGKPLTAVALGVLHDRGLVGWHDSLSQHVPEWAMFGQPDVTLAQLLTHTAGLQNRDLNWPDNSWETILSEILQSPLRDDWPIGQKAGYVVASSWFLLGEVISRITALDYSRALHQLVLEPLGMEQSFCGIPEDQYPEIRSRLGKMFGRIPRGLEDLKWDSMERVVSAAPGGNFRGPVRELGVFYEALLPKASNSILEETTRTELVTRHRSGLFDETFRHHIDWGYGLIVNSRRYGFQTVPYGFGQYASDQTFGHGGSQSSMGFADTEHQIVVAWVTNGRIGEPRHQERNRSLNEAIYRDLGFDE